MGMPNDLLLVRHGESEGNAANRKSRAGDDSHFTEAHKKRSSSKWRLTNPGVMQAEKAGEWIRTWLKEEGVERFDRMYTSEYVRAMETAGHLWLPGDWFVDINLRERDYGVLDVMTDAHRREHHASEIERAEIGGRLWAPPGGESIVNVTLRNGVLLNTLHRECDGKRVIVVCHGETIWGFRMRLERMTGERYEELEQSEDPKDKIHNCQIIHYTRKDPETGEISRSLSHMRSVWPVDPEKSQNTWEKIHRPRFTCGDLLTRAAEHPRLIEE